MPTSHPFQLDDIVQFIIETAPQSILDIGVGFGKYGVFAREYLGPTHGLMTRSLRKAIVIYSIKRDRKTL